MVCKENIILQFRRGLQFYFRCAILNKIIYENSLFFSESRVCIKMLFICPKCKKSLTEEKARCVCPEGHSYDRARGGYYNLLLSGSGGVHGDNKEMVIARRRFLGAGFYRPLADRLAELVLENSAPGARILDAGLGEGYYTDIIERALFSRDGESCVCGFDISKDAVREAAKKNPRISLAVAGSYHIPAADGSFDTVVNTFSPLALDETRRVLRSGGVFIMVIPGVEHLFELKSAIYDTPYKNTVEDTALVGFNLIADIPLTYQMNLNSPEDVASLFMMTPYAYRTSKENASRVFRLKNLECTADFRIFTYKKI